MSRISFCVALRFFVFKFYWMRKIYHMCSFSLWSRRVPSVSVNCAVGETGNNDGRTKKKKCGRKSKVTKCRHVVSRRAIFRNVINDRVAVEKNGNRCIFIVATHLLLVHRLCHTTLVGIINFRHDGCIGTWMNPKRSTVQLFLVYRRQWLQHIAMKIVTQLL